MSPSSGRVYYVRSDTVPTHFYAVTTDDRGLLTCECKSAQYRRTPCKHCRAVAAGTVRPATPKAAPALAPRTWLLSATTRLHGPNPFGPITNAAPLPADTLAAINADLFGR